MGDSPAPSTPESMSSILEAYAGNLPKLVGSAASQILPYEEALLAAKERVSPREQALNTKLYAENVPKLQQIQAQSEKELLTGSGRDLALASQALSREVDPEYFKMREKIASGYGGLIDSLNPNDLTGGEAAAVERAVNKTNSANGLSNISSPTSSVSNALKFADRLDNKKSMLTNALGSATAALSPVRSGADVFAQSTGRTGTSAFSGQGFSNPGFGSTSAGFSNNLLGTASGLKEQEVNVNANRRSALDKGLAFTGQALSGL